jgi:hypothetical protein
MRIIEKSGRNKNVPHGDTNTIKLLIFDVLRTNDGKYKKLPRLFQTDYRRKLRKCKQRFCFLTTSETNTNFSS